MKVPKVTVAIKDGAAEIVVNFDGRSQLRSTVSWDNSTIMDGLRAIFGARDHEKILAVTLSEAGITAEIERE